MILQDLIDELLALQPASARSARVIADNDDILAVFYEGGVVSLRLDDVQERYDEAYAEGKAKGYEEGYEAWERR